ncbi:MAG: hypothetical protein H6828_05505 [Planctomycetes bacterium]|nr:hypothetical protein [Planctomycetota bacterium]
MPYGIQAVDDEPHGCPPWIARVAVVCMLVFAVIVLRMIAGVGLAYAHFKAAPKFADFVAEHPVDEAHALALLPPGEELAEGRAWSVGDVPPDATIETLVARTQAHVSHGDEVLLDATVEVALEVDAADGARLRATVRPPAIATRAGMRALVQVGLVGDEHLLASPTTGATQVVVDALVVAGEGPDLVRVVRLDAPPPALVEPERGLGLLRAALGLVYPRGELPEEGYVQHLRAECSLTWARTANGHQGLSVGESEYTTNCIEYSYESRVTQEDGRDELVATTHTSAWSRTFRWNESVW